MGAKTTKEIAEFVHDLKYEQIPSDLVSHVKDLTMGYFSTALAGSVLPNGQIASRYVKSQGASEMAGVFGGGFLTSLEYAALANAVFAHATELEDVAFPSGLYTLTVFAPVIAIAEHQKMSGRNVIEAFVVGYDVAARLGMAGQDAASRGWMLSAVFASVGNAGAAAKLFGLNLNQTINALSIGASQGTGLVRQAGTGAHTYEAGFAARNGICAATLAKAGLDGSSTILEGASGMFDLIVGRPEFDLYDGYRTAEIGIRKYPCCGLMQRTIDGMSDIVSEYDLSSEDVESIDIEVNQTFAMYVKYPDPVNAAQTRFSINHVAAACFLEKSVFLDCFTDEAAQDPRFKEFGRKVNMIVHQEWEHGYFPQPAIVTVKLKNGQVIKKECVFARGDAGHPVTPTDVMKKYMNGIEFAGILSNEQATKAAKMIESLEDVEDISELTKVFSFPDRI